MKHLLILPLVLLSFSYLVRTDSNENIPFLRNEYAPSLKMNKVFLDEECTVEGFLENIAGNTFAIKFTNKCDTGYRVYYQVVDKGRIIQETSSTVVRAKSGNSTGTIHCSSEAFVKIIRKEKI